jgi:hypothetical protein
MLLSGVDTHRNGLGNMDEWTAPNQVGKPGYEGCLNDRVVTRPQLLKATATTPAWPAHAQGACVGGCFPRTLTLQQQ